MPIVLFTFIIIIFFNYIGTIRSIDISSISKYSPQDWRTRIEHLQKNNFLQSPLINTHPLRNDESDFYHSLRNYFQKLNTVDVSPLCFPFYACLPIFLRNFQLQVTTSRNSKHKHTHTFSLSLSLSLSSEVKKRSKNRRNNPLNS